MATFGGLSLANAGGGIDNEAGTVAVSNCAIADSNLGIANAGTMAISNCTIANNQGGGGVDNTGTMTITNSTIANNNAGIFGGGIYNAGTMTIVNCTIAYNTAFTGAGIWIDQGTVTLNNSIVALNHDMQGTGGPEDDNISGNSVSTTSGHNLIGTGTYGGLKNRADGNRVDVAKPLLGTLAENGGPTQTIALLHGSPAKGAGSVALAVDPTTGQPLATDERGAGFARVVNGKVDIGALESSAAFTTVTPPTVTGERVVRAGKGNHAHIKGFELTFSEALNSARARNQANFIVMQNLEDGGQTVKLKATYHRASHSVSLTLAGSPAFALGGEITVIATAPSGVTSTSGVYLDGNGAPGSDAVFSIPPQGTGVVGTPTPTPTPAPDTHTHTNANTRTESPLTKTMTSSLAAPSAEDQRSHDASGPRKKEFTRSVGKNPRNACPLAPER